MTDNIAGKVVVITGASSGLGEATARLLAAQGALLALGARRLERIQALASELGGNAQAIAVETDVIQYDQVKNLVDTAVNSFGRIDIMINNAGLMPQSLLESLRIADWDQMIDVNIKGVLYGIAAVLPVMQRQNSGHIINISSTNAHGVKAGGAVYGATKCAVNAISEAFRQEAGPTIRSTIISPGAVTSELHDRTKDPVLREKIRSFYEIAIPARAIADAVLYAMSQPADVDINEIIIRPTAQEP